MNEQVLLQENIKNKLKYELHLSRYPDEQLIRSYQAVFKDVNKDIFPLKRHATKNLLYGCVRFDENIEEEWFIIYILFELSKFDQDLVIRVHDSDGDILLIEAAEHLPDWLESSKSKNRAFIHKGHLHIIPENINLEELLSNYRSSSCSHYSSLTVTQVSAQYIREMNRLGQGSSGSYFENFEKVDTLASSTIQGAIREQLVGMPDKKVWLSKKFKQLDDIISSDKVVDDASNLNERIRENLSLASVMAMNDDYLRISPINSPSSSVASSLSASSSSSWMSEQQND